MSSEPKFYNVSERYGDRVPVTLKDYRQLNPRGVFRADEEEIREYNRKGALIEVVARIEDEDEE